VPSTKPTFKISRNDGTYAEINLHLKWDASSIEPARQSQIFEGLGIALAAALDPDERRELLQELQTQMARPPRKRRAKPVPEDTIGL
jgi:hypothetical protein